MTLLLCLCRSSFIRLKGLKQAVRAHLLLHIKPSLPYLHYRKCMHRCLLRGFGNRNMSNKVALLRWSEEIWLQALENQPRRFKPSLNCLNSPTQLWNEHKFHPRLVCPVRERWNGKCWRFKASNKIRKGIKLQSWKCAAASACPRLHTENRYLTRLQRKLVRISDQEMSNVFKQFNLWKWTFKKKQMIVIYLARRYIQPLIILIFTWRCLFCIKIKKKCLSLILKLSYCLVGELRLTLCSQSSLRVAQLGFL